jgi:hypothetical protein
MFHAWWSMGKHLAWWLMEGSNAWWPLEREGKTSFSLLFTFPFNKFYLNFYSLILRFYFTMVLNHYFTSFLPFPWPVNCNHAFWCTKFSTHSLLSWFWSNLFPFLEFMVLCITTSYELQVSQMNEEFPHELSLDLTLAQHPRDEDFESRKVRPRLEVDPLHA